MPAKELVELVSSVLALRPVKSPTPVVPLPVTPVVLAHRYLAENGVTLRELADKIVGEQRPAHDDGYYFYNERAGATYMRWASANLELWRCIKESLDDPTVEQLLATVP